MQFEKWFKTDLQQPLEVQELKGIFFTGDEDGNLIGFEVYDGGTSATLSGTCVGYIIRPDGVTVTETGTISGNKASIVLPAAAYYHEGAIDIVIKVTATNNRVAVGAVRAYVQRSTTNVYADPSPVVPIPSVEELLEIIELCEQATTDAQNAAGALNNMDAVATTLTAGSSATASITTVDGHYRITLGIPRGNTGATGATGATGQTGAQGIQGIQGIQGDPASITSTVTAYQVSTNGVNVPTGEWSSTIPNVPQGSYLWIRTVLTWNGGSTTTLYSVSRMGVDGSGSVSSVNSISPDGNGNVELPYDSVPTQDSVFPCTSGGVYTALQNKQQILTFDTVPTYQSTNPVTSDGIYTALSAKVSKSGDTMTGALSVPTPFSVVGETGAHLQLFNTSDTSNPIGDVFISNTNRRITIRERAADGHRTDFNYPAPDGTSDTSYDVMTSKGGTMTGNLAAPNYIVRGSASGVSPAIFGRNNSDASLGTIDFFTTGQIQFRSYVVGVGSENYKLPVPTSAGTEYSILTSKVTGTQVYTNGNAVNVANNTTTNVASITLPAGIWIVQFMAIFASNSTGYRQIGLGTNSAETHMNRYCKSVVQAASGTDTQISITTVVTPSSQTTYYLNVVQTSGSTLSVTGGLDARRLL